MVGTQVPFNQIPFEYVKIGLFKPFTSEEKELRDRLQREPGREFERNSGIHYKMWRKNQTFVKEFDRKTMVKD